jgi:hypothetical protein
MGGCCHPQRDSKLSPTKARHDAPSGYERPYSFQEYEAPLMAQSRRGGQARTANETQHEIAVRGDRPKAR